MSSNEYMRKYMLERYHRRMSLARKILGNVCRECHSIEDLEIDHIEKEKKKFTLGKLWSISEVKFFAELKKCQLLCGKCHRKKTLVDLGQRDARQTHGTLSSYRYCRCVVCKESKRNYYEISKIKKQTVDFVI